MARRSLPNQSACLLSAAVQFVEFYERHRHEIIMIPILDTRMTLLRDPTIGEG